MASEMIHFPKYSYVKGDIRVELNLDRFSEQFTEAQQWLGDRVLEDCKPNMPFLTGNLQQRSHTEDGGRRVVFPGPYARFQYGGLVMVDEETGSPFALPGNKKVLTNRPLKYSAPQAVDHWFDETKAQHGEYWITKTKEIAGGG